MDDIEYKLATEADIQTLVDNRIEFLTELVGAPTDDQLMLIRTSLTAYFEQALRNGTYYGVIAWVGNDVAGTGGMTIREQPGSFKNPTGKVGYIMNMYTVAAYRRQGICSHLLKMLMDIAREIGITTFELHATTEGAPVYSKCGFEKHSEPTYRKYEPTI